MWNVFYCCLLLSVSTSSLGSSKCTDLNQLDWLIGHWSSQSKASGNEEIWRKVSPLTFEGVGNFFDEQGNFKNSESLRLVQMSKGVFYLAKVKHNLLPIAFEATQCGTDFVRFENRQHDFPNVIHYQREGSWLVVDVQNNQGEGFQLRLGQRTKPSQE